MNKLSFKDKLKTFLKGSNAKQGFISRTVIYSLLIGIGFIFLYPILYMITNSFKDLPDLMNSSVKWIPSSLYLGNFSKAFEVLNYWKSLMQTMIVAVVPSIAQMIVAAFVGYGFAIFKFKGKNILLVLVLATFIIPPQITVIPRYVLFNKMGLLGSVMTFVLPALFGQGLNSAIFILIFYQTFKSTPRALLEAARLDGAGEFKIFYKIAAPSAGAAFIISFLFSLVWYWNETYLASIFLGNAFTTLPLELQKFVATFNSVFPSQMSGSELSGIHAGIELAATLLTILPLLLIYFVTQNWFVASVDRSGITGE